MAGKKENREETGAKEKKSLFTRVFGNYYGADKVLKNGSAAHVCEKINAKESALSRARDAICRAFTESRIKNGVHAFLCKLLYVRTRDIGIYLISSGLYSALEYFVLKYAFQYDIGIGVLYAAAVLTVLSLFFFSGRSLADTLYKNKILSFAVFDLIGADKSKITEGPVKLKNSSLSLLLGMITGLCAFLLNPGYVPLAVLAAVLFIIVMYMPEAGTVLIASVLPFARENFTLILCGVTFASYMIKVVRRKRVLRFSLIDVFVMLLGAATLLSRIASPGGASLYGSLYAVCIFAYFLCRNLLCRKQWLIRAFSAAALSCVIVSSFGLFFYLFGTPDKMIYSRGLFSDLSAGMSLFLGSSPALASYLLLASPFLLYLTLSSDKKRLAYFIAYAFSLVSLVFTQEVFAVAAAILANFIVLALYSKKAAVFVIPSVTAAVIAAIFIPPAALPYISGIVTGKLSYTGSVWKGVFGLIGSEWLSGAGAGSFPYAYPVYAVTGFGDAPNAQSMYLQIAAEGGVLLLILFAAALTVFTSYCVSNLTKAADKRLKGVIYAALTAVISVALFGFFDSILTDNRICTLLFFVIGLGAASAEMIAEDTDYERITMTYTEALNEK